MAGTERNGFESQGSWSRTPQRKDDRSAEDTWENLISDARTPLYASEHSGRYERQRLIRCYEGITGRNLIVVVDSIAEKRMTVFQELLGDCDHNKGVDMILASPGGSGEMALRMVKSMQDHCPDVRVIVPDLAKSAATVLCLGADKIIMGPAGDLGPIDPQMLQPKGYMCGAKEVVRAVDDAEERMARNPSAFPLLASLISEINMLYYEQAQSAIARSGTLMKEALAVVKTRTEDDVKKLSDQLKGPLIDTPTNHAAVFSFDTARANGLPVDRFDLDSKEWKLVWALWTRYFALKCYPAGYTAVYEGERVSHIEFPPEIKG